MKKTNLKDIQNIDDIKLMVDSFYTAIRNDDLLATIFNNVIQNNWTKHLEKMYRFWQTVLLEEHTYTGSPFPPHITLPIGEVHFNRWLQIFKQTIDNLFVGDKATEAKWRADKMATMFLYKINYYNQNNIKSLI